MKSTNNDATAIHRRIKVITISTGNLLVNFSDSKANKNETINIISIFMINLFCTRRGT